MIIHVGQDKIQDMFLQLNMQLKGERASKIETFNSIVRHRLPMAPIHKLFFVSALKKSEEAVAVLEEKRRAAEDEAAAFVKAKEEAEKKRLEVEELAKQNELEKEQMVCVV